MALYPFYNRAFEKALNPFSDGSYSFMRPSRLLDQHFGFGLDPEDLLEPSVVPGMLLQSLGGYLRPWRSEVAQGDTGSTVSVDKDRFQANLDVQQFKPDEISVKLTGDNTITIEGKHAEKQDEHGYISRHFVRRYVLPKNCDATRLQSKLSSDGVLTITAPSIDAKDIDHRAIPIQRTGEPAKKIESKKIDQKKEKQEI